jgi:phosphatidylinositol alpha-1,6-mannosyltransferase
MLALLTDGYGGAGGIAQYNRDLFAALHAARPAMTLRMFQRSGRPDDAPAWVDRLEVRTGRLAYASAALRQALRWRPEHVFCGHLFMLSLAWGIAVVTGARLWLQVHGIEAWQPPRWIADPMLRRIQLVSAVSRDTRARFLAWAPVEPHRVRVLGNTVAPSYRPADRAVVRARLGLQGKPLLLSVGRLAAHERYKGQDRVLRCLPSLLALAPQLRYIIAGDGDDRARLESLAHALGVADHVDFRGGVPDAELRMLYQAADLFVLPSTGEGFGIVFLEAMASGTPALGLDVCGSADPLGAAHLGHLTSAEGLCNAIATQLGSANPTENHAEDAPTPNAAAAAALEGEPLAKRVHALFGHKSFNLQVACLVQRHLADRCQVQSQN